MYNEPCYGCAQRKQWLKDHTPQRAAPVVHPLIDRFDASEFTLNILAGVGATALLAFLTWLADKLPGKNPLPTVTVTT